MILKAERLHFRFYAGIIDYTGVGYLQRKVKGQEVDSSMKQKFIVTGMTCSACSAHVEKAVSKLPGAKNVNVNLLRNSMTLEYDTSLLSEADIIKAVEDSGYGASVQNGKGHGGSPQTGTNEQPVKEKNAVRVRLILSFLFSFLQ